MHRFGFLLLLILLLPGRVAAEQAILSAQDIFHPVLGTQGMVASQEATATRVGLEVLKGGGNAVDAAVAVGFALAVTLPRAGNLGGGGFMLIHMAESGETLALDYREEAPVAAGRDLFLDADGKVDNQRARFSYLSAGVPGTVAGLSAAQARFGRLSLAEVLAPAIRLAEEGMPVSVALAEGLAARAERLKAWPETARVFFKADGSPYSAGEKLVQSDLAWSLKEIARDGAAAFYEGEIGQRIAADMKANDGLITESDLAAYDVVWREPVTGSYRGYAIASMPPPSSGGVHLVQILNLLESYPLGEMGAGSAATLHVMAEAMKLAYADRSQHLGDPDFWKVPQRGLTSKAYASRLRQRIDQDRALAATEIGPGDPVPYESNETTHFSVADRFGNVVSNTYTINFSYGSGIVAKGTGILLNNEMDDFSAKPGTPNAYGLIGGAANAIEPGKRPLSSMTPTLVFKDGKPWLVTGSPGGSRIITTVLQIVLNTVDHGMNVAAATAAPRMHHQWLPDELRIEPGFSRDTLRLLAEKGHRVVIKNAMGSTQSLLRIEDGWTGASDPRRPGALTLGY
ncbi:MAG: gamma-glutamyltransferase [Kiloniellales bacterium]|nr:gamma-glutamyltransferase [Kiloniellales bacterium]